MIKCGICGKELKGIGGLSLHVKGKHKDVELQEYYDNFILLDNEPTKCIICNAPLKFKSFQYGYQAVTCGRKCGAELRRRKNIEKHGVENISQLQSVKDKKREQSLKKYGTTCTLNNDKIRAKAKKTWVSKYGVDHPMKSDEIMAKSNATVIKKYGSRSALMKSDDVRYKTALTNFKHYGVRCNLMNETVKAKIRKTNLEKYGAENPFGSQLIIEKKKKTTLANYNVPNPSQSQEVKNKKRMTFISNYGTGDHVKNQNNIRGLSTIRRLERYDSYVKKLLERKACIPLFTAKEFALMKTGDTGKFLCKKCGDEFSVVFKYAVISSEVRGIYCPDCTREKSMMEYQIIDGIKAFYSGSIKHGKYFSENGKRYEVDIYLPEFNLGIEMDGLYWHSDKYNPDSYHIDKTKWFKSNLDIDIVHVFEDEWVNKKEIVLSIIKNRMGLNRNKTLSSKGNFLDVIEHEIGINPNRVFARKTKIIDITSEDYKTFLDINHIQGGMNSSLRRGLIYNNELIAVAGFGKSRFQDGEYELHRFCPKINYSIPGSLSKLIKGIPNLATYCDKRYFNGNGYKAVGFVEVKHTKPSYFYVKGMSRLNRMMFQKHKLEAILPVYDPNLSERKNMNINGYDRIYDCGTIKLIKKEC